MRALQSALAARMLRAAYLTGQHIPLDGRPFVFEGAAYRAVVVPKPNKDK